MSNAYVNEKIFKHLEELGKENKNESELLRQIFSAEIFDEIGFHWKDKYQDILDKFFKELK
jgi:hypothetical protein